MKLQYRGDRDAFTALMNRYGIYGTWRELGYQMQYITTEGAIVNWYPRRGTVMVQGVPEDARSVRVLLEKMLTERSLAAAAPPRTWSELRFGTFKGQGKTWPEIALSDPNYIGYLQRKKFRGPAEDEFEYVAKRAQRIRIPRENAADFEVRHCLSDDGRYLKFDIQPKKNSPVGEEGLTEPVIDLLAAYRLAPNHWYGGKKLIESFNHACGRVRAYEHSRSESELFFEDDANFVLEG